MSKAIEANKKAYYAALNAASKTNKITDWIIYFIHVVQDALKNTENEIDFILKKAAFFNAFEKNSIYGN